VNPEAFKVIDGKLYLSFSKAGSDNFAATAGDSVAAADRNWEKLNIGR
jgi:hypothetical protein